MNQQAADSTLDAFIAKYAENPRLFVREVLGKTPYPWQDDVLATYGRRQRLISCKSGHGVGKSTVFAWMMTHHMTCRFPQKTVVTAPSQSQLWDALWAEFKATVRSLPTGLRSCFEIKSDRIELIAAPEESFVSARTARAESPDALQGVHAPFVLLIADEASGIPAAVFEAAIGSMSGEHAVTLLAGNPVRAQGFFFDTFGKLRDLWWTKTVSCFDVPQAVSKSYIEQVKRTYGEHSNAFRIRVLGEFPTSESDVVIPFDLVEAATTRDIKPSKTLPVVWGVDVARMGDDRTALVKRRGAEVIERPLVWTQLDNMEVAGRIHTEYTTTPLDLRPAEINIDVIGWGAGVNDRLRQLGLPARGINVSESPALKNKGQYRRLRDELWFEARTWFAGRTCRIPLPRSNDRDDLMHQFIKELTTPKYSFTAASNLIQVEAKDDMRKRGMDSPDLADAFVMTMASDAVTLIHGGFAMTSWKQAQHRKMPGIV